MRIGYAIAGRSWMYTTVVARAADLAPRHSVVNQWDLLRPLGIEPGGPADDPVEVPENPAAAAAIAARLRAAGVTDAHTLVVIHVSAGNAFRRWPAPAFEDLVVGLVQRDGQRRVVLTSGPSDADAARRIADARARGSVTRPAPSRNAGSSISPSSGHWWRGPRCPSGATAGRCTWPPPPRRRLWRCWGRH